MVGLIDLVPTILDLLSLERPHTLQGISSAPLLRQGSTPTRAPSRVLFAENDLDHRRVAARSDGWKVLVDGPAVETYDLVSDPGEHTAALAGAIGTLADAQLRDFEQECQHVREDLARSTPSATTLPPPLPDPDRERRLKALGYLE